MISLNEIKNTNLRNFLTMYRHFQNLDTQKKEDYIKRMKNLSEDKQEEVYLFLKLEQERARNSALASFYEKVALLENKLTNK